MESVRRQRLKDARLAWVVLMVAFLLGVLIGKASACDSFDNCLNAEAITFEQEIANNTKAIAIKLSSIENELKKMNEPVTEYTPVGPIMLKKEKSK